MKISKENITGYIINGDDLCIECMDKLEKNLSDFESVDFITRDNLSIQTKLSETDCVQIP
jgi:hypothetical protein